MAKDVPRKAATVQVLNNLTGCPDYSKSSQFGDPPDMASRYARRWRQIGTVPLQGGCGRASRSIRATLNPTIGYSANRITKEDHERESW